MRPLLFAFLIGLALLPASAFAEEASGRVRGVYYEAARGVLVDASMLRRPSAVRWVDVELIGDFAPERKRQLVQMPAGMNVQPGDTVALRLGEPKSTQLAEIVPGTTVNKAIAVNPQGPSFAGATSLGASTGR